MCALRFASAAALASALFVVSSFGGCGGDAFQTAGGDASSGEGGSGSGGGDGMAGEGGDGPTIIAGQTVYVAMTGKDVNSGLSPTDPVRTIKKGLDVASTLVDGGQVVPKVLVCAGDSYPEDSLQITFDVQLLGSWDCTTDPANWKRGDCPGHPYCFPSFTAGSTSDISFANTTKQAATLLITGASGSATLVDGFVIAGATSLGTTSKGIDVSGMTAAPKLTNLAVTGGAGTAAAGQTEGSVALHVEGPASPVASDCLFDGGSGKGPTGSIGIKLTSTGKPSISNLIVSGGSGSSNVMASGIASVGIETFTSLTQKGGNALSAVAIAGADGQANGSGAVYGLWVPVATTSMGSPADVDLYDSGVFAAAAGAGSTAVNAAVELDSGGTITLADDRIWGGSLDSGDTEGVRVRSAKVLGIANCEIHAGDVVTPTGGPAGIDLVGNVPASYIAFNTIYSGKTAGSSTLVVGQDAAAVTLEDNLLLGDGSGSAAGTGDPAIVANQCTGSGKQFAGLDFNAFVNSNTLLKCNDIATPAGTPPEITTDLDGTTCSTACGNVEVFGTFGQGFCDMASNTAWCVYDASCPGSPEQCLPTVLGSSWSAMSDDGAGSLGFTSGADGGTMLGAWQIESPANWCKITHGAYPLTSTVPTDLLAKMRATGMPPTAGPTMGAVEYMGSCK